jgi:hypothetical protein
MVEPMVIINQHIIQRQFSQPANGMISYPITWYDYRQNTEFPKGKAISKSVLVKQFQSSIRYG